MDNESSQQSETPAGDSPAPAGNPIGGLTPAQLLGRPSPSGQAPGQTPAQLLGVDGGLSDAMGLGETFSRNFGVLSTDMGKAERSGEGKGADAADNPTKEG